MPTEEYYKAKFTGIADMSKPGAVDGLISRERVLSSRIAAQAGSVDGGETVEAGDGLGFLIGLMLPYLFILFGGWVLFYKTGIKMGLGINAETFPIWYACLMIFLPPIATFLLRKIIVPVFLGLLLLWGGYAIIF